MIDPSVPWVLLRVRDQLFAVPAAHIREMAEMPPITRVPNMPEFVLGLISLRGQTTPTIDMRRRLGVATAEEDVKRLTDELDRAGEEHRRLAERLESAVQTGCTAGIETEACAFQNWCNSIETKNPLVRLHLKKLDEPHARLHAAAARVVQALDTSPAEANAALHRFQEKELAAFARLLPLVQERLVHAHRQIVVVLTLDGQSLGAAVDEVESIEPLKPGSIEELPARLHGMRTSLTKMVGRRTRDDEIVLLLEVEELFQGAGEAATGQDWFERATETPVPGPEPESAREAASTNTLPPAAGTKATPTSSPGRIQAEAMDECGWCGDHNGPWVRLQEGPLVQPGVTWANEEAEISGSPGSPWM